VGELAFGRGKTQPAPTTRFNQMIALEKLLKFAEAVDADDSIVLPPQIAELIQPGTSLGGARPKNDQSVVAREGGRCVRDDCREIPEVMRRRRPGVMSS
jgi:hypothetical protein